jgi:hypothetical protein
VELSYITSKNYVSVLFFHGLIKKKISSLPLQDQQGEAFHTEEPGGDINKKHHLIPGVIFS